MGDGREDESEDDRGGGGGDPTIARRWFDQVGGSPGEGVDAVLELRVARGLRHQEEKDVKVMLVVDHPYGAGAWDNTPTTGRLWPPTAHQTKLRGVSVLTVMATPGLAYRLLFGNVITKILFRGTFGKMGVKHLTWLNHPDIDHQSDQKRRQALVTVQRKFAALT